MISWIALFIFMLVTGLANTSASIEENAYCKKPEKWTKLDWLKQGQRHSSILSFKKIENMLNGAHVGMKPDVVNKVLLTMKCARNLKPTLVVVDFTVPSNQKRFWVFDLYQKKMLYHTHVSHGIKSGILNSNYFSNRHNSKASSLGIFATDRAYYGRHGLSLKLAGLEQHFNDHAFGRAIVMHGGWYVEEDFIKKYGRAGRSWGCPAVPDTLTKPIINKIKDNALFIAYYPSDKWLTKSRYLNCKSYSQIPQNKVVDELLAPEENRDDILFVEKNHNNRREENEPIIVISANDYQNYFQLAPPLKRMLRCRIDKQEYIALNKDEFQKIIDDRSNTLKFSNQAKPNHVLFVIPEVKRVRGYYKTFMKILDYNNVNPVPTNSVQESDKNKTFFTLKFGQDNALPIKTTSQFIRWLGL